MNYVLLKWGSLKGYNFEDDFIEKNKKVVEELADVWDKIYNNHCSAFGGSEEVQKSKELKLEIINVLQKLFDLGVPIQNNWDNTYYNNMEDIKNYILNYGSDD